MFLAALMINIFLTSFKKLFYAKDSEENQGLKAVDESLDTRELFIILCAENSKKEFSCIQKFQTNHGLKSVVKRKKLFDFKLSSFRWFNLRYKILKLYKANLTLDDMPMLGSGSPVVLKG